jgi:hypothetical protein
MFKAVRKLLGEVFKSSAQPSPRVSTPSSGVDTSFAKYLEGLSDERVDAHTILNYEWLRKTSPAKSLASPDEFVSRFALNSDASQPMSEERKLLSTALDEIKLRGTLSAQTGHNLKCFAETGKLDDSFQWSEQQRKSTTSGYNM